MNGRWRQRLGAIVYDVPRLLRCAATANGWRRMRNRNERLSLAPWGGGIRCDWEYTRPLHVANVFPAAGRWLLRRALRTDPIRLQDRPERADAGGVCANGAATLLGGAPVVSFIIGHRGAERRALLATVLRSIAAQRDIAFECIVVEQDTAPTLTSRLPDWVRYTHTPASADLPYCRSWAFNVGAALARGELLILHDNDLLAPQHYAARAAALRAEGYEVINLKRFIFYLARATAEFPSGALDGRKLPVEAVIENATGGGSVAISRSAFEAIGGMDEDFVGWGGEDVEFWDRCRTRRVWEYGELPFIHLWHPPQAGKRAVRGLGALTADLTERRLAASVETRIAELRARERGRPDRPPRYGVPTS